MTLEVTVEPDETSELERRGRPDQNHLTRGLGRPASKDQFLLDPLFFIFEVHLSKAASHSYAMVSQHASPQ